MHKYLQVEVLDHMVSVCFRRNRQISKLYSLPSHQQCIRISVALNPQQCLILSVLLILANLVGVQNISLWFYLIIPNDNSEYLFGACGWSVG